MLTSSPHSPPWTRNSMQVLSFSFSLCIYRKESFRLLLDISGSDFKSLNGAASCFDIFLECAAVAHWLVSRVWFAMKRCSGDEESVLSRTLDASLVFDACLSEPSYIGFYRSFIAIEWSRLSLLGSASMSGDEPSPRLLLFSSKVDRRYPDTSRLRLLN
jgi:hypothetical protein